MDYNPNAKQRILWDQLAEKGAKIGFDFVEIGEFFGWIVEVGDESVQVAWAPGPMSDDLDDEMTPPYEWISYSHIYPDSLMYWDKETNRWRRFPSGTEYQAHQPPQRESRAPQNEPSDFFAMSACLLACYSCGIFGFAFLHVYVSIGPQTGSLLYVLQIVLGAVAMLFATLACILMGFPWGHWCNRSINIRSWLVVAAFWSSVVLMVSVR